MATIQGYDFTARMLHWISALFFVGALLIGLYFSTLDYRNDKADYATFLKVVHWHKTFGVLVFALVFYRLYHRWRNPPPQLAEETPAWMKAAAWLGHMSLYWLIFVLGASGVIASDIGNYAVKLFNVWPMPQFPGENRELADLIYGIHIWLGNLAAILLAVHIAAALVHHFVFRDNVLRRMVSGRI